MNDADREAFERLVDTRSQPLLRTAYLLVGDWALAEDLLQTALAKLIPRWRRLREPDAAEAYVRRIMATTAISWSRRRWHGEVPWAEPPHDEPDVDRYAAVDARDTLRRALAALTPRQRAVVVLRFYEDLPEEAVAEHLGCSVGTVKSTTSRALAILRRRDRAASPEASAG